MRTLFLLTFSIGIASSTQAQIPLLANDTPTKLDFSDFAAAGFTPTPGAGQFDSDNVAIFGFDGGNLLFGATQATAATDFTRGVSSGGVTTGGVYAFDTGSGDIGFGAQGTGNDFTPGSFYFRYQNATGSSVNAFNVSYEIKVINNGDRGNSFNLSYAIDAGCATADPSTLTFAAPVSGDDPAYVSPTLLEAAAMWQTVPKGVYLNNLAVSPGDCLILQFLSADVSGAGSRDEFALDDLTVTSNPATPLPVELSAFTATADGTSARLAWTTESETGNAGFHVETLRGSAWQDVAFVAGRGTTSERTTYAHTVSGLAPGRHAFRLRQLDMDGTATLSPTVEVVVGMDAAASLRARGRRVEMVVRDAQSVRVDLVNALGQRVAVLYEGHAGGGEAALLEVPSNMAAGVYRVRLVGAKARASVALVLAR